jgi:hypothetical protein
MLTDFGVEGGSGHLGVPAFPENPAEHRAEEHPGQRGDTGHGTHVAPLMA